MNNFLIYNNFNNTLYDVYPFDEFFFEKTIWNLLS
jgi:hypothetical protein